MTTIINLTTNSKDSKKLFCQEIIRRFSSSCDNSMPQCLVSSSSLWKGGFSVSLFWPAPDCKSEAQRRRRKRKRKPKATSKLVPATCVDASNRPKPSTETARATIATQTHEIPISANHHSASPLSQQLHCNKFRISHSYQEV